MLAKMDAGTMHLEKSEIKINTIIKNIIERLRYQWRKKSIKIALNFKKDLTVLADGERIAQVFSNLLDNAIKFTPRNGIIEIITEMNNGNACISIKDSGIGIPENELGKIFERFFQVDKSRENGDKKGVGLGLSIANQIVQAHGGEITVTSELGKGSCFMVKIPLAHESE